MDKVLLYTDFSDLKLFKRGKVRDVYLVEDNLLIVATDRISCFDVVLSCGIPNKGKILTQISLFWFDFVKDIVESHLITADVKRYPNCLKKYRKILDGRSMFVKMAKPIKFECVVRGYLAGSAYKDYKDTKKICGIKLPKNLKENQRLQKPIFTPATKEEKGHDRNVDEKYMQKQLGKVVTKFIKETSLKIYKRAADFAEKKGVIIADTKFEYGFYNGKIILIDEILTPDSSRFWPKSEYKVGVPVPSFDKQFVRDYLESINWDKTPPPPTLPARIIKKTEQKYKEAYRLFIGKPL
ncbi:MAG: phosphoribosylaminoimidazolesuccinocarboxamide synthase [Candidatus Omnitrophica bacterium]|nr:phosphoribosylaminoimidazolesuccinocarboxamide synthase [Candidatus Omnitrophota bacterium]